MLLHRREVAVEIHEYDRPAHTLMVFIRTLVCKREFEIGAVWDRSLEEGQLFTIS